MIRHALPGLHGPADPGGWPWDATAYGIVAESRVKSVKVLIPGTPPDVLANLRAMGLVVVARIFLKPDQDLRPLAVATRLRTDLQMATLHGVQLFEVHNEPNLGSEGLGQWWTSGRSFAEWLIELVDLLRVYLPEARFLFPGLSPGPDDVVAERYDAARFFAEAAPALAVVEGIGVHAYPTGAAWVATLIDLWRFCRQHPRHLVALTETGDPSGLTAPTKAAHYAALTLATRWLPSNFVGLYFYVLSASDSLWDSMEWRGQTLAGPYGRLINSGG